MNGLVLQTSSCGHADESSASLFFRDCDGPSYMRAAPSAAKPLKAATPTAVDPCDVCGGPTYERNCKVICHRCGYTRDCSDP